MNAKQAAKLLEAWDGKPCDHSAVEKLGAHTGLEACTQCGRVITRDSQGKPIPSPGGRQSAQSLPSQT